MQSISMEDLNKLHNTFIRHSGVGQNQVKTIVYSALSPESLYLLRPCSRGYRLLAGMTMEVEIHK